MLNKLLLMNENFLKYSDEKGKINNVEKNNIKQNFFSIVGDLRMNLFYYKSKLENKIIKEPKDENLFKEIKNLIINIKKYFKEENPDFGSILFEDIQRTIFILNYSNLLTLIDLLINVIEKIKNSYEFENFNFKKYNLNFKIKNYIARDLIENFAEIKTLKIRFNDISNNKKINLDVITLFSYYFNILFPTFINLDINFNIDEINKQFNNINPYKINQQNIISISETYETLIISNLILVKTAYSFMNVNSLSIKLFDSYQIESHYILSKLYLNNEDEINRNKSKTEISDLRTMTSSSEFQRTLSFNSNKNKGIINPFSSANDKNIFYHSDLNNKLMKFEFFINNLMKSYYEMNIQINSFDPLLFNYCNLSLIKDENLCNLKLNLFPNETICLRKILMNCEKYNLYSKNKININSQLMNNNNESQIKDKINETLIQSSNNEIIDINIYNNKMMFYYNFIPKNNYNYNKFLLLKNEEILNELFYTFNINLFDLNTILDHKMNDFIKLSIDLTYNIYLENNIENFDNYNSSIACFIFNLFLSIQNSGINLNSLEIIFNDDNLNKKTLIESLKKKKFYSFENGFNFSKLKISEIIFDFNNVCSYINFENFPHDLSSLELKKLSTNDFILFLNYYKSKNNVLHKLEYISFEFDYDISFKIELIEEFILYFKKELKNIILKIPINMNFELLIKLIKNYKKNKSNTLLKLKIFLNEISSNSSIIITKEMFDKNLIKNTKIIKKIMYMNNNNLVLNIPYYKNDFKERLYSIIFCFEKINKNKNINNNMENIYKKIFFKISKINEKNMEIEII